MGQHPELRHANTTADNSLGTKPTTQSSSTKSFYNSKKNHHTNAVVVEPDQGVKFLPWKTGKCEFNALLDTGSCFSFIPSRLVDSTQVSKLETPVKYMVASGDQHSVDETATFDFSLDCLPATKLTVKA